MTPTLAAVRPFARGFSCSGESALSEGIALMCASALFTGMSSEECRHIASCAKLRRFARDETLFMQGEPAQYLLLIQTGSIKLTQLSSTGNEVILWMSGPRETIGISADPLSSSCRCSCSARAVESSSALVWEYSRLRVLLEQYPRIRANINHILSSRLEELEERFREIATERVAKRLALALLRLMKQVGRPHNAGTQVSLSREEMAQLIGTTLFTISRILSKWSETGLVLARREFVVVCDPTYLRDQADIE